MKALVALGLLAASITLTPGTAGAQERTGDAALGALADAVVAGPFGLVAGGVVGYTAGPGIASEWRRSGTGTLGRGTRFRRVSSAARLVQRAGLHSAGVCLAFGPRTPILEMRCANGTAGRRRSDLEDDR